MMLKRIMTFAAVSAMTVALAGSAMAAETTKQLKPAAGSPNKIKFTKEMKVYNVPMSLDLTRIEGMESL
mgnify:CR=1 FL=1